MPSATDTDIGVRILLVQLCPCHAWMTTHVQRLQRLEAGQFKTHVVHPYVARSNHIFASLDLEMFNAYTVHVKVCQDKSIDGMQVTHQDMLYSNQLYFAMSSCQPICITISINMNQQNQITIEICVIFGRRTKTCRYQ